MPVNCRYGNLCTKWHCKYAHPTRPSLPAHIVPGAKFSKLYEVCKITTNCEDYYKDKFSNSNIANEKIVIFLADRIEEIRKSNVNYAAFLSDPQCLLKRHDAETLEWFNLNKVTIIGAAMRIFNNEPLNDHVIIYDNMDKINFANLLVNHCDVNKLICNLLIEVAVAECVIRQR